MPTARELLDQADALMRRNRKHGKGAAGDVPTLAGSLDAPLAPTVILTDAHASADRITLEPPGNADRITLDQPGNVDRITLDQPANVDRITLDQPGNADRIAERADASDTAVADPMPLDTLGDLPILTDAVLDWPPAEASVTARDAGADTGDAFPASAAEAEAAAAELPPPAVLEREGDVDANATDATDAGDAPGRQTDAVPAEPRVPFLDDDFILEIPPPSDTAAAARAPSAPPPGIGASTLTARSREWDALAEEIRMQVLQRLDIFTDTALRDQLGARLSPIVERASAQLIETINRELGELVRGYVAEAIEREIESWRTQNPK
ncbi:MAG TPA: hypothetical protein VLN42_08480 [Casimicrobiaceae bacterium]|nr:hypothetical protein [Casimicrobiaceae bacterium]